MFFLKKKPKKLGLALGGGAARGFAHLGIIKGLNHFNVPIHYMAGTSAGSIIGALVAGGVDIDTLIKEAVKLSWRDFAGFHISKKGLFSSKPIESLIHKYLGDKTFSELSIPFAAMATDILSGDGIAFCDKNMAVKQAVRASASFPGMFAPVQINDRYYFDGGAANNIPCSVVREMGGRCGRRN